MDLHRLGEERSIAMHREVAARILTDGGVLDSARARVGQWIETGEVHRAYAEAWRDLLDQPPDLVARALVDRSDRSRDLRQVSPFAGVLDPRTRWRIRREVARAGQ